MSEHREEAWNELIQFADERRTALGVPGAAVGIIDRGEECTEGFGVTSADHPLPVTSETLFQIGSITKTFTATLLMQWVEASRLDLDAPIRAVLPTFRVASQETSERATPRHLLTHTGGWVGDLFEDTGSAPDALERFVAKMADVEQMAPLGEVWSYNNAGFAVAGRLLEALDGSRYPQILKDRLLGPLGVRTCFLGCGQVMTERFAVGHSVGPDGARVASPWPLPASVDPVGGIACDIRDLLIYARFHLGDGTTSDGTRLLTKETLETMHTPVTRVWGNESWGLPFSVIDRDGVRIVSHGGGTVGQSSLLVLVPDRDFALGILTNADRGAQMAREICDRALHAYLDVPAPSWEPIDVPSETLRELEGHYERPFASIDVGLLGERLIAQLTYKKGFPTADTPPPPPPPPMTLSPCAENRLLVLDGPMRGVTVDIVRSADGMVRWLRAGGRIHRRLDEERTP